MTNEEKMKASLAEFMGAMRQIIEVTDTIEAAKWIAAVAVRNVHVIATQGRIPDVKESMDWVRHNIQGFTQ